MCMRVARCLSHQGPIRDAQRHGQALKDMQEADLRPVGLRDFQV
jgi:hypothetical protein